MAKAKLHYGHRDKEGVLYHLPGCGSSPVARDENHTDDPDKVTCFYCTRELNKLYDKELAAQPGREKPTDPWERCASGRQRP